MTASRIGGFLLNDVRLLRCTLAAASGARQTYLGGNRAALALSNPVQRLTLAANVSTEGAPHVPPAADRPRSIAALYENDP